MEKTVWNDMQTINGRIDLILGVGEGGGQLYQLFFILYVLQLKVLCIYDIPFKKDFNEKNVNKNVCFKRF